MKRIITIFTIMCLLLALFIPFVSANSGDVEIISVSYTAEGDEFTLEVKGTASAGMNVSLVIRNQNSVRRSMEQVRADSDGNFTYIMGVDITEDKALVENPDSPVNYTLYARGYNNASDEFAISLYSNDAKNNILSKFNGAATTAEMVKCINDYNGVIGFTMTYCDDAHIELVADNLIVIKNAQPLTLANALESFDKAVILAYLFNTDYTEDRVEIIDFPLYADLLSFGTGFDGAPSPYSVYKNMEEDEKATVNSIAFAKNNKTTDFAELKERFFMAVTAERFVDYKDDFSVIDKYLKDYNDWFKLENYEDLENLQITKILSKLVTETIPNNKEDFAKLYDKYYKEISEDDEPVKKPVTDGTSGGGGGGGGGAILPPSTIGEVGFEPQPETEKEEISSTTVSFDDMSGYGWATDAVMYLANKGVVNGKSEGKFAPGDSITREEFAKILVLTYGLYDENAQCEFTDVPEDRWSYKYIASLNKYGIVQGYPDGSFGATSLISRQDMAVMMYRVMLNVLKIDHTVNEGKTFNDKAEISEYALNSVMMLSSGGVISGDDNGNFNPHKNASRAEVCQMIYNSESKKGGI